MRPRLGGTAQLLEALAQREVGVVRRRVDLEQLLERRPRPVVLAGVVVGLPQRLELERVPFEEALAAAERGEIVDAKSLVGLFWLDRLRRTATEPS